MTIPSKEEARLFVCERLNTLAYVEAVQLFHAISLAGTKEYGFHNYTVAVVDGVVYCYSDTTRLDNHLVMKALLMKRHFGA